MPSGARSGAGRKGGARPGAGRKKVTPEITLKADKGIASRVLASIDEEAYWRELLRCDVPIGQIHMLPLAERSAIKQNLEYLTNKRDGKPAQGVFVGDTRESARELDFGDLPELVAAGQSQPAGKPN